VETVAISIPRQLTPERIVRLEDDAVVFLDQRRLPGEEVELRCHSAEEVAGAIRTLALAVLANYHSVPLYVVAPTSTAESLPR
jgi:methylthioribose-1-phosphate isomerase